MTLTDAEGAQRTSVTDETGAYAFDFVRAGEYTVTMALPGGMMFTRDGTAIAMTDASEASTEAFTLAMGESRMDLNAGAIVPASVTGRIGVDADESGTLEDQEEGLGGVVITLVQGGTVVATTDTRPDGTYVLSGCARATTACVSPCRRMCCLPAAWRWSLPERMPRRARRPSGRLPWVSRQRLRRFLP